MKCPNCGAPAKIKIKKRSGSRFMVCEYCGSRVKLKHKPSTVKFMPKGEDKGIDDSLYCYHNIIFPYGGIR